MLFTLYRERVIYTLSLLIHIVYVYVFYTKREGALGSPPGYADNAVFTSL